MIVGGEQRQIADGGFEAAKAADRREARGRAAQRVEKGLELW